MPDATELSPDSAGWNANLRLEFGHRGSKTLLQRNHHNGPLYVQKPFYPEGPELAHIYLLHPPGGIVVGDTLRTQITAGSDAGVLLTTPGANRFYGRGTRHFATANFTTTSGVQTQINQLNIAANASLEWLPLETLIYNDANARMKTEVVLQPGSRYIGWEFNCLGLPASDEPFTHGSFHQSLTITLGGKPLFIDRLRLDDGGENLRLGLAGLRGHTVYGTLVAGPFPEVSNLQALVATLREGTEQAGSDRRVAITVLNRLVVARYLGDSANQGRRDFLPIWQGLRRELLARDICEPRIWAT